jgi:hypothetical protein
MFGLLDVVFDLVVIRLENLARSSDEEHFAVGQAVGSPILFKSL